MRANQTGAVAAPLNLSVKQAAEAVGLSESYLNHLRSAAQDESPPFFRMGRRVLYPAASLQGWAEARMAAAMGDE